MRARLIENNNFERGLNEPSDLGLGRWKSADDIIIPLHEFKENGGVLTKGREIWRIEDMSGFFLGYWLDFDSRQHIDLMYNDRYKSVPIPPGAGVKCKAKVLYQ